MPPIPPPPHPTPLQRQSPHPRIILYQQTHHHLDRPISLLPLLTGHTPPPSITHLILAAIHLNPSSPATVSLNDHPPTHPRFTQLWDEVLLLQDSGVKVLCMLGGAAPGTFARLDYNPAEVASLPPLSEPASASESKGGNVPLPSPKGFEQSYLPLRDFIRAHNLDGIDLDVEEPVSLQGIIHLIDRLRLDFGTAASSGFVITLAPVATALVRGMKHLSGFDYFELERLRGGGRGGVDWWNVQFYNGWGGLEDGFPERNGAGEKWRGSWYDQIVRNEGWNPERVVLGLLTNPRHGGSGYVRWEAVAERVGELVERYPGFGGVMGWEYWGAVPELEGVEVVAPLVREEVGEEGEEESHYWRWAWRMRWIFAMKEIRDRAVVVAAGRSLAGLSIPADT